MFLMIKEPESPWSEQELVIYPTLIIICNYKCFQRFRSLLVHMLLTRFFFLQRFMKSTTIHTCKKLEYALLNIIIIIITMKILLLIHLWFVVHTQPRRMDSPWCFGSPQGFFFRVVLCHAVFSHMYC